MSTYEISKSSLLSLKAEILRKQEEVKQKKHETVKNVKKSAPLILKNKGVDERSRRDEDEDLDLLEKSRKALESKAKLYDKLSNSKIIEDDPSNINNRFLVRFKDKEKDESVIENNYDEKSDEENDNLRHYEEPDNSDDEWVEYVDVLGRTRTCLRKDLSYFKSKDKDYKRDSNNISNSDNPISNEKEDDQKEKTNEESSEELPQMLSDDMRRELLRQQWEAEELELRNKNDIHYQDILFNEARSHGVGYFAFSKDEEERRKQQESLEKLRLETKQEQKKSQELKAMREKALAARVKAAKMRKRARLGLPPEEEDEEKVEIGPPVPENLEKSPEQSEEDALKERLLEEARRNHVRPWDIGKEKKEFYEYTQDEWVEKRRRDRNEEFAPPTTYKRSFRAEQQIEIDVPTVDKSLRFTTVKNDKRKEGVNPHKNSNGDFEDPFDEETRTFNYTQNKSTIGTKRKIDSNDSLKKNFKLKSQNIEDPSDIIFEGKIEKEKVNEENSENTSLLYDPYDIFDENLKDSENEQLPQDIEASVEAGLKFLKQQMENKGVIRDYANDDMFAS